MGNDDLIILPACKANLLHSEGCSYDGATHEGDIGEWGWWRGGTGTSPRRVQTHLNEDACARMQILCPYLTQRKGFLRDVVTEHCHYMKLDVKPPRCMQQVLHYYGDRCQPLVQTHMTVPTFCAAVLRTMDPVAGYSQRLAQEL